MGTSSVLKQMAEYDFTERTDVTIIYDDNEFTLEDNAEEQENLEIDNDVIIIEENCVEKRNRANLAKLSLSINDSQINTPILEEISGINNTQNILNNNNCEQFNKNHVDAGHLENENSTNSNNNLLSSGETLANKEDGSCIETEVNNHKPINKVTENALNKLSELLAIVIQLYYLYVLDKNTVSETVKNHNIKKYASAKLYYFNLAFNLVELIIIPQEHNNDLIDKLLDKAVNIANAKCYPWRCQKSLMKSTLTQLIYWTKKKRTYINHSRTVDVSNQYITLKQQLDRPLKPFSIPQSKTVLNNSNTDNQSATDNVCIFSSGNPGSEISINVSAEILRNYHTTQCSTENTNKDYSNNLPNPESSRTNTSSRPLERQAPPPYEQHMYQNNYSPSRHTPPQHNPYNISQTYSDRSQYQTNTQVHRTQTYTEGRQAYHRLHQHVGYQQQSHQNQIQYVNNIGQMNNNPRYAYYDNMNQQNVHIVRPVQAQPRNPVAGHVGGFNQTPIVRCHMCGKYIPRHSPYSTPYPCTVPFCSNLCKGSSRGMIYQDVSFERKPFVWRTLQEHNDTIDHIMCRNSVQGKSLLVDDRGYVCHRSDMTKNGCCDTDADSADRYSCETCTENNCCIIYEYCVSCCLDPSKRDMLEVVLSKLSTEKNVLFRSLSDDYELCLTKCRTSSHSVLHENSYKDPINKHCFGDELPRSRTPD